MHRAPLYLAILSVAAFEHSTAQASEKHQEEQTTVWGHAQNDSSNNRGPYSVLNAESMSPINAATTEDLVKYEPSLVIRRRFIGDSNGTMGIRGANMFQTPRSMVFADGVPLHYLLQTRWSGAPRWSLVSADEIEQVEVIYGPFSAEYSGNAMGGVVNIETRLPTERKIHLDATVFNQTYDELGFDENLSGYKGFASIQDRLGAFSYYASYHHLENDGHTQNFRSTQSRALGTDDTAVNVSGGIEGVNEYGDTVLYYADSGIAHQETDNLKFKVGYDFGQWISQFNLAYEKRQAGTDTPNSYLTSDTGEKVYGGWVEQNGATYNVRSGNFATTETDRQSLLIGGRIKGDLTPNAALEASFSVFDILEDERRESNTHPKSQSYTSEGSVRDYDDTGWKTAKIKLHQPSLFSFDNISLTSGFEYEHYRLKINSYDSDDYQRGAKTTLTSESGGETQLQSVFSELDWQVNKVWDFSLGGRFEDWQSQNGFYGDIQHIDRSESRFSPKFSTGFNLSENQHLRYSVAKAYRFPITEELFQNERRTLGTSLANENLEPEEGLHHNISLTHTITDGEVRFNLFSETVENVIFAQTVILDTGTVNTFIPLDEVQTQGAEFIYKQTNLFSSNLDLRFNLTYTDSEITKNEKNPEFEGKTFPRMPKWRSNLLMNYNISDKWDLGGGIRYASNSYGDTDNEDTAKNVFGAHDSYTFVNIKTTYKWNKHLKSSFGVDNLFNEIAYVHHPWPGRTLFLELSADY